MILDRILEQKKLEVARLRASCPMVELKAMTVCAPPPLGFARALNGGASGMPAVIAEVKKASPSKGVIRADFNPVAIATAYQQAGASAISVLTDEQFFQGSLDYLKAVKKAVSLPVIRKDFIIDESQIFEARAAGADAILLIVAALERDDLVRLMECAQGLGMDCLIEVHDEAEMETALGIGAGLIGINNRNLNTFEVSLDTTARLMPMADGRKLVSESGIFTREDIAMLGGMGVDAVLIGEALMRQTDVGAKLRELIA